MATITQAAAKLSLLSLTVVVLPALAEETKDWSINPTLGLGLEYTDNLNLDDTDKVDTFIYRASPGVAISRSGKGLDLGVNYRVNLRSYSTSRENDSHDHNLNAFANMELVENRLTLDTRATARQQLIDNRDSGGGGIAPDNFTNTLAIAITPTWTQRIGEYTNIGISGTYDSVVFEKGAEDSEGFKYNIFVDTKNNPNKLYWNLELRQNTTKAEGSNSETQEELVEGQLGYRYSPQVDVRLGGGYVDNKQANPTNDDAEKGSFWSTGLTWTPTARTSLNGYYSSRIQTGNSRSIALSHRRKSTAWSVSYQQSLTDVRSQILQITTVGSLVCPSGASISLSDCRFVAPGENPVPGPNEQVFGIGAQVPSLVEGRFISNSLSADMTYRKSKTTLSVGAFVTEREFQDGSGREEKDLGFNSNLGLRLSGRSDVRLGYTWSSLEPDTNASGQVRDYLNQVTLGWTYRLSSKSRLSTVVSYQNRNSDDASREYKEFGGGINFNHSF
ncbi:TIGR03016 family PEP-CTERM system-associated outer membrane protein [Motiliproteus coralliicola]|uniref:TIGR03016 family PEP-CTERM system-associated outer membrane protein n=1 Tax=Motiliproteus coralliicola TaxID=2283196 RepID=A0A369WQ39_9GAMM|nr:TIGR03016 family PEP-CTERM system-associated outer membrane protein [Motiliproteus coralliicola]RDE24208.1 TIGR03016 family PEP-CTERM system-associated outer membrane protein [Motiliproteus coralliicola]